MDDSAKSKRLSVERIYQKKTQLEHILLRPDTYIGSVEDVTQPMWVYDDIQDAIVQRQIKFVPGLYKIFDEILVNAADNKQRDPKMSAIKVVIDTDKNVISIWNNGRGIPVEMHKKEGMYVPSMIFGHLLTSSNYDDKQKKVTGGRNGYGAKLCNIFSTLFTVETANSESGKAFKQTWRNNMSQAETAKILSAKGDYTKVTFCPDLPKFGMTCLDRDTVALLTRRIYDLAGCLSGVKVYLNEKRIPVSGFKQYVDMYLKVDGVDDDAASDVRKVVYEKVNPRWEVCVTVSNNGFQQASFVNSIATTKGGKHVDHVVDPLVTKIAETVKKKNKGGMELRPHQIKSHLWIFVNCLIENPAFDSQTKENMTLKQSAFGSKCEFSDKFVKEVLKCGVVESCIAWAQAKSKVQLNKLKKGSGPKNSKLRGIAKLDDANNAGGKAAKDCTLIVTEGDSAKALAISGLSVVGRDSYGVFPLRGKLLNVRDASHKQLMSNEEIMNLVKIIGLEFGKRYGDESGCKLLRYGHLMIMADQDQDGSHIKGLVINFIHHNWPELLRLDFVREFITPIVKATKGGNEIPFFSLPEFEHWKATTENHHTWKVKYYKGLGTSTSKEAKEYFSDMDRHCIKFKYGGVEDDRAIELAFSKDKSDMRKEWLTEWLGRRREKRELGLNESYLYGERVEHVTYSEFVNKELILFSNADNERSIPSLVDGLKPGQRKVLFTCLKRNDKREVKVAQLAGSVAELSAYHHGEASLMSTIINLAQNFVGSNNLNLLQPLGQFGTRLCGGKDAASPRYIFTMLSPLTKKIFNSDDDHGLKFLSEDNLKIEPEWYCPIIPLILVNGCEGIGTGYSTSVPNHDPREVVENLKRMMNGLEPLPMAPKYKQFRGTIAHVTPAKYSVYGNIARLSSTTLEITELPIRKWTQDYKESVLEPMLHGTDKVEPYIQDYKEYHTDTTVKFVVTLSEQKMEDAVEIGFHKKFKLEGALSINNMVLFDASGCLKRFRESTEILKEFYSLRLERYRQRKEWLEGKLQAEADKITQQARFVLEMYNGTIVFQKKSKSQMIGILKDRKYPSDPVKMWKSRIAAEADELDEEDNDDEKSSDYNYLLGMPMWNMSLEKKNELLQERDKKVHELETLKSKSPKDLWNEDLDDFLKTMNEVEEQERQTQTVSSKIKAKPKAKGNVRQAKLTAQASQNEDTKPSAFAEVIEPKIPAFTIPVEKKPKVTAEKSGPASATSSKDPKQGKLKFPKVEVDSTSFFDDDNVEINVEQQPEENLPKDDKPVALVPKKRKRVALTRDSADDHSFDSDSDMDFNVPKNVKKGPSQKKAPTKKKSPTKKPTVTKLGKNTSEKGAKKKKVHSLSDSEGECSEEVAVRRKRGVKQDGSKKVTKKKVCKSPIHISDDSSSKDEEDDLPLIQRLTRKKTTVAKYFSDDNSDDNSVESKSSEWEISDD